MLPWRRCSRYPTCLCRWQRDRRDALTWQGTERSPCRQGATRAAQGPDPGLCLPSPQVRPHVTDFADPLRVTRVWPVKSTTAALGELADHLRAQGIERIVIESTSDYWRPFVYLLEAAGLSVWLVNAAQVKHVPGRPKTDKLDAVWLAKLAEKSMVSPSFVPAELMRQVRDLARARFDLVEDRARVKQRVEKLLEDALIKISSVLTDVHGTSGRAMLE